MAEKRIGPGRPPSELPDTPEGRVGVALRTARKKSGLSATEAAKRAGLSRTRWYELEAGDNGSLFEGLALAARAVGLDPAKLVKEAQV